MLGDIYRLKAIPPKLNRWHFLSRKDTRSALKLSFPKFVILMLKDLAQYGGHVHELMYVSDNINSFQDIIKPKTFQLILNLNALLNNDASYQRISNNITQLIQTVYQEYQLI